MELSQGHKKHPFSDSPLMELITIKKGFVKYRLLIDSEGQLLKVELRKNDFDTVIENLCRKEIESIQFIPPDFLLTGQKYCIEVTFKFNKRFKSFSETLPKKSG